MRPDSLKVGDKWFNINGVHPAGKLMLLAADVAEAVQGGQHELKDDEDTTKLACLQLARHRPHVYQRKLYAGRCESLCNRP